MLQARTQSQAAEGKARPDILIYTRQNDAAFQERFRGTTTSGQEELVAQKKRVETFIAEEFHDAETHANIRAHHSFDQPVTFAQRLRVHLEALLDEIASLDQREPIWDIETQGLPFLGLEAYQFEHAPVFFGREDEIAQSAP